MIAIASRKLTTLNKVGTDLKRAVLNSPVFYGRIREKKFRGLFLGFLFAHFSFFIKNGASRTSPPTS